MRAIETFVAARRHPLWQTYDQVLPHLDARIVSHGGARDWFNVSRDSFFNPMMLPADRRKREMHHLA